MRIEKISEHYHSNLITKGQYIAQMYSVHDVLYQYSEFIKTSDIRSLEIADNSVIFTTRTDNIRILGIRGDHRIAPIEILNFSEYEPVEFAQAAALIPEEGIIFDIGANIGFFSLTMAKRRKNLEIHAFEPILSTYEYLVTNKKLNGAEQILTHNIGLSNTNGDTDFYFYRAGSSNASNRLMDESRENIRVRCKLRTLDDFALDAELSRLDFIKCDIEGAELFAFQGGINTITKFKPVIFTEILRKWAHKFDYHPNEIIYLLAKIGYKCFYIKDKRLNELSQMDETTTATNFFFLTAAHIERHALHTKPATS
jgi:FkbM family methyltransferase